MIEKKALAVDGGWLVTPFRFIDYRGELTRLFSRDWLLSAGLETNVGQVNLSTNPEPRTLRGLHWQLPPMDEAKIVYCIAGAIFDVFVDLRSGSPTFGQWEGCELKAGSAPAVYVPPGCAHGFLTLVPDSVVLYTSSQHNSPASSGVLRWDDPDIGITWPDTPLVLSERDRSAPDIATREPALRRSADL
jgi:dTDP-4-dehydrorhamnose 3,5-epimerase